MNKTITLLVIFVALVVVSFFITKKDITLNKLFDEDDLSSSWIQDFEESRKN